MGPPASVGPAPAAPPSMPGPVAAARSSALMRSHWRFTSDAVRATASPNTCGWRRTIFEAIAAWTSVQVEDAGLGGKLRVEDDLEPQYRAPPATPGVAPASSASYTSYASSSRCLRRGWCGSVRGPTDSRPGARRRSEIQGIAHGPATASSGATGAEVDRPAQPGRVERADGDAVGRPDRPTGWSAGYSRRSRVSGSRPRRAERGRGAETDRWASTRLGAERGQRNDEQRARRPRSGADERLAGHHLESVRRSRAPSEAVPPRRARRALVPPATAWSAAVASMVASRVMATACFLALYQVANAFEVSCVSWRCHSGVRVSSAKTLNKYEPSPPMVVTGAGLADRCREDASVRAWLQLTLGGQPRSPPMLAVVPSELSPRRGPQKSAPLSRLGP